MASTTKPGRGDNKRVRHGLYTGGMLMVIAPTGLAACSSSDTGETLATGPWITSDAADSDRGSTMPDGAIAVAPALDSGQG